MQLNFKNYQKIKIKNYLIKNHFIFFSITANQNSQNWVIIEQNLYKLKLKYHKTYNNITIKILKNSIFKNFYNTAHSTFFFFKPKNNNKKTRIKNNTLKNLNSINVTTLSLKLNNKIYAIAQMKNINSFCYKNNILKIYQFLITNLKFSYALTNKKNISKQCDSNT